LRNFNISLHGKFATGSYIGGPPSTVYITALPRKNFIAVFPMVVHVYYVQPFWPTLLIVLGSS